MNLTRASVIHRGPPPSQEAPSDDHDPAVPRRPRPAPRDHEPCRALRVAQAATLRSTWFTTGVLVVVLAALGILGAAERPDGIGVTLPRTRSPPCWAAPGSRSSSSAASVHSSAHVSTRRA